MTVMDIVQIVFLVIVVAVGIGGMIWVIKNENK
jgi:heme/copper-type cytochrome/quinol oxidase subunit 4